MAEKMAEQIAEILKGPNFQTAEKALTDFCGTMDGEYRNLLVDIIVERWIDTPKYVPFSCARSIWNRKDINREEYRHCWRKSEAIPSHRSTRQRYRIFYGLWKMISQMLK